MNEKIKELAEQAGIGYGNLSTGNGDNWQFAGKPEELERFAELIIQECAQDFDKTYMAGGETVGNYIRRKFGVEE
jgi:hypothetical protein